MTFRSRQWVEKFPEKAKRLGVGTWDEKRKGWVFGTAPQDPAVLTNVHAQRRQCRGCGESPETLFLGTP